ncbi:ABC transporter ATP-binding protein [Polaribacter reichenbachii]|uniref:ABC transporter ATP-binding protein n=1 Tax=Polaribacter reichenbachii TaxID=996801 RepID=A0A1B8TUU0_9FLAO|nr:ABC transporter ATP-binding protein [Polaribacter reichenbachii]APZ45740.1 ABC transporter ATP-binding protein [Polaribacter reichenbachii]AUC19601.1 ABC transporter ATP-binding protein [Polaribacter reichenbachii]OBY63245.1 ABC transporter ATP-binding protein [Polaribacter reichenbachii]
MLKVNHISFGYSKNKTILENFNFTLKKGEHLCVMGESGCGKSTLLKTIYGLLDLQKGNIFWNDEQVLGPKNHLVPGFDKFKYVAQDFDLMPYISVSENIKKFLSRFYPEESEKRTQELLNVIEMNAFANTKVKNLSGGQKQRVAIARALAKEPELLLLDEPFGQIDNFKKNTLRRNLFGYLKQNNIACIVATHDKNDALSFADKLLVIRNHKILVNDNPKEIYHNPKEKYVAALFDDVNEIIINNEVRLLYPHQIKITDNSNLSAKIVNSYFKGNYWLIEVSFNNQTVFLKHSSSLKKGELIHISIKNHLNSK